MTRFHSVRGGLATGLVLASSVLWSVPATAEQPVTTPVTKSAEISRIHLVAGRDEVVERKTVSVTVSATTNLRDRQGLDVSWSGAHPTGGVINDPNSGAASQAEYPMALMQCRGTPDTIDPTTCWAPTEKERFQSGGFFEPWRVDRYAVAADRTQYPGLPTPLPTKCSPNRGNSERWMQFLAADGTKYPGGNNNCGGLPPEASAVDGTLSVPTNTTYAPTEADGTGSVRFDVRDAQDNASLGCSQAVPCALVAIPIMGISCDVAAAGQDPIDRPTPGAEADAAEQICTKRGTGQSGLMSDLAVNGQLWWSASNWKGRITFPLTFAPPANVCDIVGGKTPVQIYGSELMTQAATQWAPTFCLNGQYSPFRHIQTGEPQARNLLGQASIEAALTSDPPGGAYRKPTVHAPVAVSGFAISFSVDDANRRPVPVLRLNARLLAKLMTESYPANGDVQREYSDLRANPLNMSFDPEFIALNPGISKSFYDIGGPSTLYLLSSDSDVVHALTSYVTSDPDARAWLDGKADPWGTVVNTNYKGIALPVDSWPLLDTFIPQQYYNSDVNNCLHDQPDLPYLPLVASPTQRLATIALAMQYTVAYSQVNCLQPATDTGNPRDGEKLGSFGRQSTGSRFMLGLTSLGDAERFGLRAASLQSQAEGSAPVKFTDATGRTFVAPTNDTLKAAVDLVQRDDASQSWPIPYDTLRTDARGAAAYPGAMLIYADVPTVGLPKADATAFSQFLDFAAGPGQTPGLGNGQLPPGYLPMTAANGLGALVSYTQRAARDVALQNGGQPLPTPASVPPTQAPAAAPPPAIAAPPAATPSQAGAAPPAAAVQPAPTPAASSAVPAPAAAAASSAPANAARTASVAKTLGDQIGLTTVVLVVLIALALLGPVTVPLTIAAYRLRRGR